MKKITTYLFAFFLSISLVAQNGSYILSTPEVAVEYQITAMSPNGLWACGNINDGNYRGFLWNLVSGEVTETSAPGDISIALGIDDNGTIVGTFTTTEGTPNNTPIETYGTFKNGKWHELAITNEDKGIAISRDGYANAISRDGRTIGGIAKYGSNYVPVVWIDGVLNIVENATGAIYDVSADGKTLCGWTMHPKKNNRTCAIWTTKENLYDTKIYTDTISAYSAGPFCVARKISPNGRYVAAYDRIYDLQTDETFEVDLYDAVGGFEFYGVTNSGKIYGYYNDGRSQEAAWFDLDGKKTNLRNLLIKQGVNVDKYPNFIMLTNISEDEKTFGLMSFDLNQVPRSLIVKTDVDTLSMSPVALKARMLEGVNSCRLVWNKPFCNFSAVQGYNIYRNGTKLNNDPLMELFYIDKGLTEGKYDYEVTALYNENESNKSEILSLDVNLNQYQAPRNILSLQSGFNDVRLLWDQPYSNKAALDYYDKTDGVFGFGGGNFSFEAAIRIRKEELALYKENGYKLSEFTFQPLTRQTSWTLNLYEEGNSEPFYSEMIPSENLCYGQENRFVLSTPVEIPIDKDLIVGLSVDVTDFGGYKVLGVVYKPADEGYSDLLRQAGQENFFSMHQAGLTSTGGSYECNVCWAMSLLMSKQEEHNAGVKKYAVFENGVKIAATDNLYHRLENVSEGEHTYQVAAVYSDDIMSDFVKTSLNVQKDYSIYKGITPSLIISGADVLAEWSRPVDNDESQITFANDENTGGVVGAESNQYSYMVASIYSGNKLRTFDGYKISGFRFYPLADADFTFILEEDGREIANVAVDRSTGYTIGKWNFVKLDNPIIINRFCSYRLILDCYDVTPGCAPIGMDSQVAYPGVSDLYSIDDGESFLSLVAQGGKNANWMIGLVAEMQETKELPIEGYKVYLDNKVLHENLVTDTHFKAYDLTEGPHQLRVNPVYGGEVGEKRSTAVTFMIDLVGIGNTVVDDIVIEKNENSIKIIGSECEMTMYSSSGMIVARSTDNIVYTNHLDKGIYVLKVKLGDKSYSFKVFK